MSTHSPSNLNLVVHTTPVTVIRLLRLVVELHRMRPIRALPRVCIRRQRLRLGLVERSGRELPPAVAAVPDLEDNVEDFAVDLPWRAAQDIQAGIYQLALASVRCVLEVRLLFTRTLEPHGIR